MDPALAALIGAGVGATSSVVAAVVTPVLAARRADHARRREIKREIYLEVLETINKLSEPRWSSTTIEESMEKFSSLVIRIELDGDARVNSAMQYFAEKLYDLHLSILHKKAEAAIHGIDTDDRNFIRRVNHVQWMEIRKNRERVSEAIRNDLNPSVFVSLRKLWRIMRRN